MKNQISDLTLYFRTKYYPSDFPYRKNAVALIPLGLIQSDLRKFNLNETTCFFKPFDSKDSFFVLVEIPLIRDALKKPYYKPKSFVNSFRRLSFFYFFELVNTSIIVQWSDFNRISSICNKSIQSFMRRLGIDSHSLFGEIQYPNSSLIFSVKTICFCVLFPI